MQIDRLRDEFGDIVICPGYVAQFGSKADRWGRVYVPGATSSYSAARKVWAKWKAANEDQLFSWWPAEMERRKVEPILVSSWRGRRRCRQSGVHSMLSYSRSQCKDVLDGLSLSRWQAYRKEYLRASGTRNSKARRERSRQEALAQTMEEDQAAEGLLGLGVGATGSTS